MARTDEPLSVHATDTGAQRTSPTDATATFPAPATADSGYSIGTAGGENIEVSSLLPSDKVLHEAAQLPVLDSEGKSHLFGRICRRPEEDAMKKRVLVIFVRHFFCGNCQEYLQLLASSIGSPSSLPPATTLVVIGCGASSLIPMYREMTSCGFPIYTDPTKRLYSLFGMIRTLSPGQTPDYIKSSALSSAVKGISLVFKRIWAGDALKSGDYSQVGGEFLFETTGDEQGHSTTKVTWCHRMKATQDHTEIPELKRLLGLDLNEE